MTTLTDTPIHPSFAPFKAELEKLVSGFKANRAQLVSKEYDEASLRSEYLDRFFASLGWDVGNRAQLPLQLREVVVEKKTNESGRNKRVDYLFRMSGIPKFVCEAKRPGLNIENFAFDTQNYAANSGVYIGILTDFEWLIVYAVGAAPRATNPFPYIHGWKLHYSEFVAKAETIWKTFSRDSVSSGLLDQFIYSLEKVPSLRLKQGWLFRPERNRAIDHAFLAYLLEQRQVLARALLNRNGKAVIASEDDLNASVQTIMDRILFQRVCEDRDIDTHQTLERLLDGWRAGGRKKGQLWTAMKANFIDMKVTFNGGLYDTAFVDTLDVSERWVEDFVDQLCDPQSNYQFKTMPVEILGSVYEQFLCYRLGRVVK